MRDPILDLFGSDPEMSSEIARVRALRGDPLKAERLMRLGAVAGLSTDEGLQNMSGQLSRIGAIQKDRYDQAAEEAYTGLKQTRAKAASDAEAKRRWEAEQAAAMQRHKDSMGLQWAQERRQAAQNTQAARGSWMPWKDEYTGETGYFNPVTKERLDARGNPVGGGAQPQAPAQAPQPGGGIKSAPIEGAFGLAPTPYSSPAAGGNVQSPSAPAAPRSFGGVPVPRVKFDERPGVQSEMQRTAGILRQLSRLEDLYRSSGGTGFGRGLSLPTSTQQQYDAGVAQLAPEILKMVRTPGEGSQSDFEARMKMLAMPYRVMPGDTGGVPESYLEGSQKELRTRLEERMTLLAQQLGMSPEEVEEMLGAMRPGAGAAAGPGQDFGAY
jgi:hypothetical protein